MIRNLLAPVLLTGGVLTNALPGMAQPEAVDPLLETNGSEETDGSEINSPETNSLQTSDRASDLLIAPRFGVNFNTPRSGDDGRSFGQASAFWPLSQRSNSRLTFMSTQARLDSAGRLGGNVALGHRWAMGDRRE